VHPRLSVNTIGFGAVPVREILDDLLDRGITVLGVPMMQLETGGLAANLAIVRERGVDVVTTVVPMAFTLNQPERWPGERRRLISGLDVAAELGCSVLYSTTGPASGLTWDDAAARFGEAVQPVVAHAEAVGVRFAIENTTTMRADLGFVHVLADAVELAHRSGVALCADLFAAWTDRHLEQTLAGHAAEFALVQVADFVLGTLQTPDRAVPGDGDIPIARQLRALAEGGYAGRVELELLGPRITDEGPARATARGLRALEKLLAADAGDAGVPSA
jgi:sugar phosphate isomerase/epimerase